MVTRAWLLLASGAAVALAALAVSCNSILGNDDKVLEDASAGAMSAGEGGDEGGDAEGADACGDPDTVQNCSACGAACASPDAGEAGVSTSACNGATCSYTCATGFLDCNVALAPNLDGCECHAPGGACCTGHCPVMHSNGLDQANSTFYDCAEAGAYTQQLALDACKAFTGDVSLCLPGKCEGVDGGPNGDLVVCAYDSKSDCPCWVYSGPDTGHVHDPHATSPNCFCGVLADPMYE